MEATDCRAQVCEQHSVRMQCSFGHVHAPYTSANTRSSGENGRLIDLAAEIVLFHLTNHINLVPHASSSHPLLPVFILKIFSCTIGGARLFFHLRVFLTCKKKNIAKNEILAACSAPEKKSFLLLIRDTILPLSHPSLQSDL